MCQRCAEHEIVKISCTSDTNTKCSGTGEYGYYYNAQDASHACHKCSHCCSDGKDEIQAECVRHGLEKRHCSLRIDTNCGPTIKPAIAAILEIQENLGQFTSCIFVLVHLLV